VQLVYADGETYLFVLCEVASEVVLEATGHAHRISALDQVAVEQLASWVAVFLVF